jgi:hypothetical protein
VGNPAESVTIAAARSETHRAKELILPTNPSRLPLFLFSLLLALPFPLLAGTKPPAKPKGETVPAASGAPQEVVDRRNGEEEAIRARKRWFFSTRLAGAEGRAGELHRAALDRTRDAIAKQKRDGLLPPGVWTLRGPASSNFGGWAFGRISGRVISLAKDATTGALYAGAASGGLWKSTDDGTTWTSLLDLAGATSVGAVAVDPANPQILWAGTGEDSNWCEEYFGIGLLRSTDGGATWAIRNGSGSATLEKLSAFASISIDPRDSNRILVGGSYAGCADGASIDGGLFSTTDGGVTWTRRLSGAIHEIARNPTSPDIVWATDGNTGLRKSTDGGSSWTLQTGLTTGAIGRAEVVVAPTDGNSVYVLLAGYGGEFWRTWDGGANWTKMATGTNACDGQCWYNMTLAVPRSNPKVVFKGTIKLMKSMNGGSFWSDLIGDWGGAQEVHQDIQTLLADPVAPNTLYVGSDGGVWKSTDGGGTFASLAGNMNLTQFYGIAIHPTSDEIVLGGAQDNSSLARNGSDVWDLQEVTGDGFLCAINRQNPNYVYITSYPWGAPSVYRSTTGIFGPFSVVSSGISSSDRANWVTPYTLDPSNGQTMYLGTQRIYKSTNGATNWSPVGPADLTNGGGYDTVLCLEVNRADGQKVWAGTTDGRIWRSTNAGSAWNDASAGIPYRSVNDIAADPTDPSKAFAVVGGFGSAHLFEWDGSGSWQARGAGLPNLPTNTVLLRTADEIYVGNDAGLFRSLDRGTTFTPFMNGLPLGVPITDLQYNVNTGTMTAGTYGRGAWQISLCADPISSPTPSAPASLSPANGATGVAPATTLAWSAGTGAARYAVRLGSTNPPPFYAEVAAPGSSLPVVLAPGTTWYWSVTSFPSEGPVAGASSAVASFATAAGPLALAGSTPSFLERWKSDPVPFSISGSGLDAGLSIGWNGPSAAPASASIGSASASELSGTFTTEPSAKAGRYDLRLLSGATPAGALLQRIALRAFTDVTEADWYFESSDRMDSAGIMPSFGTAAGPEFRPSTVITRGDMAEYLVKAHFWELGQSVPARSCFGYFPDVPCSHPQTLEIEWAKDLGITLGNAQGNFVPDANVTRAEMAAFLTRLEYGGDANVPKCQADPGWNDYPEHPSWSRSYVNLLRAMRVTAGCSASPLAYCPLSQVQRSDLATFLARLVGEVPMP